MFCTRLSPSVPQGYSVLASPECLYNLLLQPCILPCLPYLLTTSTCVDHSKYLLEKGEKWFAHGCPRPSRCPLSPEPPLARALFLAYVHSEAHLQSGSGGMPHSPAQECTSHLGSTAPHRGPWSVHSIGQRCSHRTHSRPPEMGC